MIGVFGGAGYIGSHFCHLLAASGEDFVVFDSLENGHAAAIANMPFVRGDLRIRKDLDDFFAAHAIDIVVHFAAYIAVGESMAQPEKYIENNVGGTLQLLEAMDRHRVGCRLVFSSTAAVYGEPQTELLAEDHPLKPTSVYGKTKLAAEELIASLLIGEAVVFRYFNAAGAHPSEAIGEDHRPETHLVPLVVRAALGQGPPVSVFGTDYPTPDGSAIRDYIHVSDLATSHLEAVRRLRAGEPGGTYNLGTGTGRSVLEVIDVVETVSGRPVPHEVGPRREGDVAKLVADASAIHQAWHWQPERSDLTTIVEDALRWHSNHPNGYQSH
ncbi:MAG: UDP-glucose 4-epimerase [Fimbriimonadaceae bacterium]|nr:UDP-glucose 4-epimerase [Fimbriimonadaceae bacterium]